mmetsp:Transcript_7051/g.20396  ORF Transcript_7051/g.20396 Transcript_7051/m.20396 type:complete len:209 (+) Transcript_7051:564-1190(+)
MLSCPREMACMVDGCLSVAAAAAAAGAVKVEVERRLAAAAAAAARATGSVWDAGRGLVGAEADTAGTGSTVVELAAAAATTAAAAAFAVANAILECASPLAARALVSSANTGSQRWFASTRSINFSFVPHTEQFLSLSTLRKCFTGTFTRSSLDLHLSSSIRRLPRRTGRFSLLQRPGFSMPRLDSLCGCFPEEKNHGVSSFLGREGM